MTKIGATAFALLAFGALLCCRPALPAGDMLARSDVVSMYPASPDTYRDFAITIVEWGGHPSSEDDIDGFVSWAVGPAHEMGVRYVGGVGMVTEFALFMQQHPDWEQSLCADVRGNRIQVPWLWDHSYEGNPAYWFCTNDATFRQFLLDQLLLAVQAGVDGIHVDDHLGSAGTWWLDGCFCDDCIAAFRPYLAAHVSPEDLTALGITDLDTFDYRAFAAAWLDANPGRGAFEAPLGQHYLTFELKAAAAVMADLHAAAQAAAGRPLTFSANAGPPTPHHIVDYPALTHFCAEVQHNAFLDENPPYVYKLSAALGRTMVATAGGSDWTFVKTNSRSNLVRAWIAQAYAFGHQFMAPHHQWCYSPEIGTHWYDGPVEDYGPVYHFIRGRRALFDPQQATGQVAVVYSARAARDGDTRDRDAAFALLQANIPFDMAAAGDDWVEARLTAESLEPYDKVIVPTGLALDADQQAVLGQVQAEGRLLEWTGPETLAELPPSWITVTGSGSVWAVARAEPDGDSAVCHLLARGYNSDTDATPEAGPVTVSIAAAALGGHTFTEAIVYPLTGQPQELDLSVEGDLMSFTVPRLSEWVVVHLTSGGFRDVLADSWAYPEIMACRKAGLVAGYPDGYYRPEIPVSRADMAVYIARALVGSGEEVPSAPADPTFPDVPADHWAYDEIAYAAANAIVEGYEDGTYHPDSEITRSEMAVYIARAIVTPTGEAGLAAYDPPTEPTFTDVPTDYWSYPHIEYLAEHTVIAGYPDGSYRPTTRVTRDQMAVYIARAFGLTT